MLYVLVGGMDDDRMLHSFQMAYPYFKSSFHCYPLREAGAGHYFHLHPPAVPTSLISCVLRYGEPLCEKRSDLSSYQRPSNSCCPCPEGRRRGKSVGSENFISFCTISCLITRLWREKEWNRSSHLTMCLLSHVALVSSLPWGEIWSPLLNDKYTHTWAYPTHPNDFEFL